MLKYYKLYYEIWYNGEQIDEKYSGFTIQDEAKIKNFSIPITWENIFDISQKNNGQVFTMNLIYTRKGRKIILYGPSHFRKIFKEWKEKELNLEVRYTYSEFVPSLKQLLEYPNSDIVLQYFNERKSKIDIDKMKELC